MMMAEGRKGVAAKKFIKSSSFSFALPSPQETLHNEWQNELIKFSA
jgi:hypothetical protein